MLKILLRPSLTTGYFLFKLSVHVRCFINFSGNAWNYFFNISCYWDLTYFIFICSLLYLYPAGIVLEEKNFPPFFPLIHHDIAKDIPIHMQRLQYMAFASFLGTYFCLLNKLAAYCLTVASFYLFGS
jgi:SCAMP family